MQASSSGMFFMQSTGIRKSRKCDPKGGGTVDSMTTILGIPDTTPFPRTNTLSSLVIFFQK